MPEPAGGDVHQVARDGDLLRMRGETRQARRSETEKALALWTKLGDEEQAAKAREELAKMGA